MKRPRDVNVLASDIVAEATSDEPGESEPEKPEKNAAAVELVGAVGSRVARHERRR